MTDKPFANTLGMRRGLYHHPRKVATWTTRPVALWCARVLDLEGIEEWT